MMTNFELKQMYLDFNRKWFGSRLSKTLVLHFADLGKDHGVTRTYWGEPVYIYVNKKLRYSKSLVAPTLLHEMVHVQYPKLNHGPMFHKRMLQLAKAGAFRPWW